MNQKWNVLDKNCLRICWHFEHYDTIFWEILYKSNVLRFPKTLKFSSSIFLIFYELGKKTWKTHKNDEFSEQSFVNWKYDLNFFVVSVWSTDMTVPQVYWACQNIGLHQNCFFNALTQRFPTFFCSSTPMQKKIKLAYPLVTLVSCFISNLSDINKLAYPLRLFTYPWLGTAALTHFKIFKLFFLQKNVLGNKRFFRDRLWRTKNVIF